MGATHPVEVVVGIDQVTVQHELRDASGIALADHSPDGDMRYKYRFAQRSLVRAMAQASAAVESSPCQIRRAFRRSLTSGTCYRRCEFHGCEPSVLGADRLP